MFYIYLLHIVIINKKCRWKFDFVDLFSGC